MNFNFELISEEIKRVHYDLDKDIGAIKNQCRKGCSHCCYQPIEIVSHEELPIVEFIRSEMNPDLYLIVRRQIALWAAHFNEHYVDLGSNKTINNISEVNRLYREKVNSDKLACPFLVNNLCSIYKARPLACRSHIEIESATKCENDGLREPMNNVQEIRIEYFKKLSKLPNSTLRYLPVALSTTFGFSNIFKPHPMLRLN